MIDKIKNVINNSSNKDKLISDLTTKINLLKQQKDTINSQQIILNNDKIQNDNLITSLTENNKNLLNKIKDVDCSIYV